MAGIAPCEPSACISGLVLRGLKKPCDCAAFGTQCTPETPLGATMVSAEGACAAYYQYGRLPGHAEKKASVMKGLASMTPGEDDVL